MLTEVVTIDHQREPAVNEEDRITRPMIILDIYGGLITQISVQDERSSETSSHVDDSLELSANSLVLLSHFSVREYLSSHRIRGGSTSDYYMSERGANALSLYILPVAMASLVQRKTGLGFGHG